MGRGLVDCVLFGWLFLGVAVAADGEFTLFISESSHNGNLGGFAGADAICKSEGGPLYHALLKDNPFFLNATGTYDFYSTLPSLLFSASFAQIFAGTVNAPTNSILTIDKTNINNPETAVWTGVGDDSCLTWTNNTNTDAFFGGYGTPFYPGSAWFNTDRGYCNESYHIYCVAPKSSGRGDPHFIGFDGCKFDFDGLDGRVFAIYSDVGIQVNAFFERIHVGATEGNWMTKIGVRNADGSFVFDPKFGVLHSEKDFLVSHEGTKAFDNTSVSLSFKNADLADQMTIVMPYMVLRCEVRYFPGSANQKFFINIDVEIRSRPADPHGVLGQTARDLLSDRAVASGRNCGFVDGATEDYIVQDGIVGTDFTFARYGGSTLAPAGSKAGRSNLVSRSDITLTGHGIF